MKILPIISFFIFYSCLDVHRTEGSRLSYDKNVFDFGNIRFKTTATHTFSFVNKNRNSLSIKYVKTNCGCLMSNWSENAIKPNERGKISVTKDTGIPGFFEDRILVYFNELNLPDTLIIKGEVIYP